MTAVQTPVVPTLPSGFSGGRPARVLRDRSDGCRSFPVTLCIGYGFLPPGTEPKLLHFNGTIWEDVTTGTTPPPNQKVCGSLNSLSPVAVAFEETTAAPEELIGDLVDKTLLYLDKPSLGPRSARSSRRRLRRSSPTSRTWPASR